MAHEIPISGHQGKEKKRQRVLRRFFWPSVFKDIEDYCTSCRICQETTQSVGTRAPLIPLPIISELFSRMAMDIVDGGLLLLHSHGFSNTTRSVAPDPLNSLTVVITYQCSLN